MGRCRPSREGGEGAVRSGRVERVLVRAEAAALAGRLGALAAAERVVRGVLALQEAVSEALQSEVRLWPMEAAARRAAAADPPCDGAAATVGMSSGAGGTPGDGGTSGGDLNQD